MIDDERDAKLKEITGKIEELMSIYPEYGAAVILVNTENDSVDLINDPRLCVVCVVDYLNEFIEDHNIQHLLPSNAKEVKH